MTTISFPRDSLGQQVGPGSAGELFCCPHLGSLIQPKSSGGSPGARGQNWPQSPVWELVLAVGWASSSQQASPAYIHRSNVLRGQGRCSSCMPQEACKLYSIASVAVSWSKQVTGQPRFERNEELDATFARRAAANLWLFKNMPQS